MKLSLQFGDLPHRNHSNQSVGGGEFRQEFHGTWLLRRKGGADLMAAVRWVSCLVPSSSSGQKDSGCSSCLRFSKPGALELTCPLSSVLVPSVSSLFEIRRGPQTQQLAIILARMKSGMV